MIVKALLIAVMAAFYFAIVPWGMRSDQYVLYHVFKAKFI